MRSPGLSGYACRCAVTVLQTPSCSSPENARKRDTAPAAARSQLILAHNLHVKTAMTMNTPANAANAVSAAKETLLDKLVALQCELRAEADDAISDSRRRHLIATIHDLEQIQSRINRLGLGGLLHGIMYAEAA